MLVSLTRSRLPPPGESLKGHNFPWFPLTRFRGKEPWRSMPGAGRGCSRTAPSACREAGQPLSPTHLFTRPPTNSPPPTLHSAPLPLAAMATTSHQTEPRARPSHRSRSRLTILCPFRPHRSLPFQQVGGRGVPAAEGRNSSFHQGALGVRVRGRPPECLPEKTFPERSRWPACWPLFFFFFNICLSITLSAYLTLSLPSFCLFFFSLSLYCRNVSLVAVSSTLLISPCHSEPVSFSFFFLLIYVSSASLLSYPFLLLSLSVSLSLSLSLSHTHTHTPS